MEFIVCKEKPIKYLLTDKAVYGDQKFPYTLDRIKSLHLGTFGDFERPYYHQVLCCEYKDDEGRHHYKIIGEYFHKFIRKKFWIFGKITSIILFDFKTLFRKEDIDNILKGEYEE